VFPSRARPLQAADLPALRVFCDDESIELKTMGPVRERKRTLELVVEACCAANSDADDALDQMAKEVEVALDNNNSLGVGVKYVEPRSIKSEFMAHGEVLIAVARMSFEVLYYSAKGTPDVAL
jgi:hypothetical protein